MNTRSFATRVALIALATGASALVVPMQAHAASNLGGVDMQGACNAQYPGQGRAAKVQNSNDAYSWRCVGTTVPTSPGMIDVKKECINQYGAGAYQGLTDSHNPYSWYCQR